MLNCCETSHGGRDGLRRNSRKKCRACGGHDIFDVVLAAQADIAALQQYSFGAIAPQDNLILAQKNSAGDALGAAEPKNSRSRGSKLRGAGVIRVQDGGIGLHLILEETRLRAVA